MSVKVCFLDVVTYIMELFGSPTSFFYLLCSLGRDTCTLSDSAMHKTMSLSIPAPLTLLPDMLSVGF